MQKALDFLTMEEQKRSDEIGTYCSQEHAPSRPKKKLTNGQAVATKMMENEGS